MLRGGVLASEPAVPTDELTPNQKKIKTNDNHKYNGRRFTEEQVRSLELTFESEPRLEPRRKVEVAHDLGLEPRQVAVWFQNKRARWRSKQLEKEYNALRESYNNLVMEFQTVKKEKQELMIQLQKLKEPNEDPKHQQIRSQAKVDQFGTKFGTSTNGVSEYDYRILSENKYFGFEEEENIINSVVEPCDSNSVTNLSDEWNGFDSENLFDQCGDSSYEQWWDFWP